MKPLCVIPARAGSKRLPGKNILPLGGQPMLAWTIKAALESKVFETVYVSTESEEFAAIARDCGATVPCLRPQELAGDTVTNVAVSLHLHDYLSKDDKSFDAIVCLQPTSPLRTATHISGAWDSFVAEKRDFLVSVTPIDPHYFHWALSCESDSWRMFFREKFLKVRQELPEVCRPNGAIKISRVDSLRSNNNFFGDNLGGYVMPEEASVHVATELDLRLCEVVLGNDN